MVHMKYYWKVVYKNYIYWWMHHVENIIQKKWIFKDFKDLADRKKDIYDEDLHTLVGSSATEIESYYELTSVEFNGGSSVEPGATVTLNVNGAEVSAHCTGDGPVNAALEAVKRCARLDNVTLLDYSISAITGGSDAQGRVNVRIDYDGDHFQGQSTDTDVVVASAEAFVSSEPSCLASR